MVQKRDAAETRSRILKTAETLFSQKGFDGTRVDDVAAEAGVNKALIYYYFNSKEEILQTLLDGLVRDAQMMITKTLKIIPDITGESDYRAFFNTYMDFATQKRALINVAVTESLKTGQKAPVIIKICDLIATSELDRIRKAYEKNGAKFPHDTQELLVMEFFTGLMPIINFALYKEQWENYYDVSDESLCENFYSCYLRTHLAAHNMALIKKDGDDLWTL